jgi:hypothetical protein
MPFRIESKAHGCTRENRTEKSNVDIPFNKKPSSKEAKQAAFS